MCPKSVTQHPAVLKATAARLGSLLQDPAAGNEAFALQARGLVEIGPDELRSRIKALTRSGLLESNPREAIERRMRKAGTPTDAIPEAARARAMLFNEGLGVMPRPGLERLFGGNDLLAIRYLDAGQRAGKAVGRIVIRSGGITVGYGTGSMISPSLLMTNNHVLGSRNIAAGSIVEFNFQTGLNGAELDKVTFALRPDLFFQTSPETNLDMTIVGVAPTPQAGGPLSSFGFNPLSATRDEIVAGESVTIIQHPGGEPKQIALRENEVLKLPNTEDGFLYYKTDTSPGSSGAPVFNDQWEVIALHHSGFPDTDDQGRILAVDGQLWREEMGDHRIRWLANEGIRVVAIRDFLASLQNLTPTEARLRDEAVNPQSGGGTDETAGATTFPVMPVSASTTPSLQASQAPQIVSSGATWTIPLTVSVNLGNPIIVGSASVDTSVAGLTITPPPPTPQILSPGGDFDDADLREARVELERARTRTYYDSAADAADREAYYAGLSDTLSPAALFNALSALVTTTHQNKPAYKPMKHVYPWVDLQPNLRIKSVYSDQEFDPLELIRRDFEIAALRNEGLMRFRASEMAGSPFAEAAMLDALEAQFTYNCEHVVPQSWFAKREPMRGDLHHLFACESKCNSFRSNIPYFDFTDFGEATRNECGKREAGGFEPEVGKGAVARATLYFLLRYPGQINANADEYTEDRLPILLQWHSEHPPEKYEKHRNQAIFGVQGNRNPLIDHPDIATKIDFKRGLGQ